mgnify:FL=1
MKQAVFITGFNNWGKTRIIEHLFRRRRFHNGWYFAIPGINANFTVESHSNDDWGSAWPVRVQNRINREPISDLNLFTALCPTMDINNNFVNLLSNPPFTAYDKLHIILIEYKWEHHAKLIINNITTAGANIPNVNFITINADQNQLTDQSRWQAKTSQIRQELGILFP